METWKPMADWPGYAVSDEGSIKSLKRTKMRSNGRPCTTQERILSLNADTSGYYQFHPYVDGKRYSVLVSREVYKAFVEDIPSYEDVDHIDSNKLNNCVSNLQCLSRSDHQTISRQRRVDAGYQAGYAAGFAAGVAAVIKEQCDARPKEAPEETRQTGQAA